MSAIFYEGALQASRRRLLKGQSYEYPRVSPETQLKAGRRGSFFAFICLLTRYRYFRSSMSARVARAILISSDS